MARRKITITEETIIYVSLFSKNELALNEIKGCRIESKNIYIEPSNEDRPTINVGNYYNFKNGNQFAIWCKENFKDLNAIDLEIEQNKFLKDERLGSTEAVRIFILHKAKRLALI